MLVIEGMIRYIFENTEGLLHGDNKAAVEAIRTCSDQLREVVKGLQNLNANCLLVTTPEKFDTGNVVRDIVGLLKKKFSDRQYEIEIDADLPQVTASPDKIKAVFECLLDNAFAYGRRVEKPSVMVVYDLKNDNHQIAVTDNGPGIPECYAEKIFDPFFRIPREARDNSPGAGVGLTIARTLAKSMGGDIHLEPSSEGGATFIFSLPVHDDDRVDE